MKCNKCDKVLVKNDKFQIVTEGVLEEKDQNANKESDRIIKTLAMQKTSSKFYCEEHKLK